MKARDLTGQRFAMLSTEQRAGSSHGNALWLCRCDCGHTVTVAGCHLTSGHTTSCGCRHASRGGLSRRHRSEYKIWGHMLDRCVSEQNPIYRYYGGRGIAVCDRWRDSFENFFADMGPRPKGLTLDRIDNDGDYGPWNCRWATRREQAENRRSTIRVTVGDRTVTLADLSRETGLDYHALYARVKAGWAGERLLKPSRHHVQAIHPRSE